MCKLHDNAQLEVNNKRTADFVRKDTNITKQLRMHKNSHTKIVFIHTKSYVYIRIKAYVYIRFKSNVYIRSHYQTE